MHRIIAAHKGELIGVNLEKPAEFRAVQLVDANADFITVKAEKGPVVHYSMRYVISASEGQFSLYAGVTKKNKPVTLLLQVYQFVVSGGGGSFGIGIAF
ncbi:hypothetical protein [Mycobacterium sp. TY815]|uniref:hypothetical protein n=1 Tax=Mycobacterium sp. TY815 TaxID=3050581 RepID=UPI0027418A2C|nr:hypothetical protein [Mycobacterium sp. TY815]MDP7703353.1 hypothetical protein [Mycobacterium sp. TY815]